MDALLSLLQFAVVAVSLGWLLALLATPRKTALHLAWGVFCGSLCLMTVKTGLGAQLGDYRYLIGMGACATCNVFWLVARGLFRAGTPFHTRHVLFAAAVAAPIALGQFLQLISARDLLGEPLYRVTLGGLAEWVGMLGSAMLVLAFWEGLRYGHPDLPAAERRLRRVFLVTYATCVLANTLWTSPSDAPSSPLHQVAPMLQTLSAMAILLVAGYAVRYRTRHPLVEDNPNAATEAVRTPDDDELAAARSLAQRIEACMRERALYLEPELKVADLAAALHTADYKVSRAITLGLGQPNFNRFINGYRVDHAKRLLSDRRLRSRSILAIGIDSGFASIGPFNRAFKASTGQTPSEFRSAAIDAAASAARVGDDEVSLA